MEFIHILIVRINILMTIDTYSMTIDTYSILKNLFVSALIFALYRYVY